MEIGQLTANSLNMGEVFFRLNQLDENHILHSFLKSNPTALKHDERKVYFTITAIRHLHDFTALTIKEQDFNLLMRHDWHIGKD